MNAFRERIQALAEITPEIIGAGVDPSLALPTWREIQAEFSFPRQALVLGIAEDGLPVLLNLDDPDDPAPGSILVSANVGAGKTAFFRSVAHGITYFHEPEDVQFGVLTMHPEEWQGVDTYEHCAGVLKVGEEDANKFILSLRAWARANRTPQSVVVFLDGLPGIDRMDREARDNLLWLFLHGPERRVWPIVSCAPNQIQSVRHWMDFFQTRIFGDGAEILDSSVGRLVPGVQFAMKEGNEWLPFWIPRI